MESDRVIIYLRHGKDMKSGYKYDQKLTPEGKDKSRSMAKTLIEKYGVPDAIYCSPFYRTRQTRRQMLKVISKFNSNNNTDKKIKNITDPRLSRFFTKRQTKNPDIRRDTRRKKAPIYERWNQFKRRVKSQVEDMEKKDKYDVIWCIGHTLIIKEVAKIKNIDRPRHIDYLDTIILKIPKMVSEPTRTNQNRTNQNQPNQK